MQHSSITTSADTGQSDLPKEATMFEQLFTQSATIAHHHSSPYATERQRYLSHLMEEGRSRNSLRTIAELLISYAQHLPLHRADICSSDIKFSAEAWERTRSRSTSSLHVGKREFLLHATKWMRLLGRLREPQVQHPFALEREAFLRFLRLERGLAPITIDHYWRSIDELLVCLNREGKQLWDVTPDYIAFHIQRGKAEFGLPAPPSMSDSAIMRKRRPSLAACAFLNTELLAEVQVCFNERFALDCHS
jgi:integrase/recombinase XerD